MTRHDRTPIEEMIGRDLQHEVRASVPRFKPGQLAARPWHVQLEPEDEPVELYELSYVDVVGHACLIIVDRAGGAWRPVVGFRGGHTHITQGPVEAVSERARAVLEHAHQVAQKAAA